jgi:hypothetical protein
MGAPPIIMPFAASNAARISREQDEKRKKEKEAEKKAEKEARDKRLEKEKEQRRKKALRSGPDELAFPGIVPLIPKGKKSSEEPERLGIPEGWDE